MKIFRKMLVIAMGYYALVFLVGCLCKCDKAKYKTYACEALQLQSIQYEFPTDSTFAQLPFNDSLDALTYGIGLKFDIVRFAVQHKGSHFSLVNQANACDCAPPPITSRDIISNIKIETLNDFDANHPQNSDVSDMFVLLDTEYSPMRINRQPLSVVFNNNKYNIVDQGIEYFYFPISLNAKPASPRYAQFKLVVSFTNGKSLTAVSEEVFLY